MRIWGSDGNSYLMARCPDEDDQMSITVKGKYKSVFSLTLNQAKDFAEYLLEHVNNANQSIACPICQSSKIPKEWKMCQECVNELETTSKLNKKP